MSESEYSQGPADPNDRYRAFWRRFFASVVDSLIFIPVVLLFTWLYTLSLPAALNWLVFAADSMSYLTYSVVLHSLCGQTLGKMALGVRVVDVSERPIRFGQAVLRDSPVLLMTVISLVSISPGILAGGNPEALMLESTAWEVLGPALLAWTVLELLTMLSNEKRRAIHDYIAGTVVVKTEYLAEDGAAAGSEKG